MGWQEVYWHDWASNKNLFCLRNACNNSYQTLAAQQLLTDYYPVTEVKALTG